MQSELACSTRINTQQRGTNVHTNHGPGQQSGMGLWPMHANDTAANPNPKPVDVTKKKAPILSKKPHILTKRPPNSYQTKPLTKIPALCYLPNNPHILANPSARGTLQKNLKSQMGINESMGVHHPNSRGHATLWIHESLSPIHGPPKIVDFGYVAKIRQ